MPQSEWQRYQIIMQPFSSNHLRAYQYLTILYYANENRVFIQNPQLLRILVPSNVLGGQNPVQSVVLTLSSGQSLPPCAGPGFVQFRLCQCLPSQGVTGPLTHSVQAPSTERKITLVNGVSTGFPRYWRGLKKYVSNVFAISLEVLIKEVLKFKTAQNHDIWFLIFLTC